MAAAADDERPPLHYNLYLGVGFVGILVFFLGIYTPAFTQVPYAAIVQVLVAIAGGGVAYFGFHTWYYERAKALDPRRPRPPTRREKELAIAPSFEVYNARTEPGPPRSPEPPAPDDE